MLFLDRLRIARGVLTKLLSIGVDLGGHTISAALVEAEGKDVRILNRVDRDTPEGIRKYGEPRPGDGEVSLFENKSTVYC